MSRSLAERAVACKGWRWMQGMRDMSSEFGPRRIINILADGAQVWSAHVCIGAHPEQTTVRASSAFTLPDLDDPATLGCLLALVRDAHNAPTAHAFEDGGQWWVSLDGEVLIGEGFRTGCAVTGKTEGEALVAALEAAPKKEAA